jgi:Gpi18-like mannosyltransferase
MRNRMANSALVVMFGLAVFLRYAGLHFVSMDMASDFIPWYHQLADGGYKGLIQSSFSYTPPYLYLLFLSTFTKTFLSDIVAIKLIPIYFDACNTFLVYKITRIKYPAGKLPILAAAVFALAPTVILNSAYWGQVDSFYTCFLLVCMYFILRNKPLPAILFFGIAFTIKAQAVFLGPFLILMALKKRVRWMQFGLVPIVYLLLVLPTILIGKPAFSAFTVYAAQAEAFPFASMNAPNLYIFVPPSAYSSAVIIGLSISAIMVLLWLFIYGRINFKLTYSILVYMALISVACVPFILPKMHERYFYPADVFSILLAFSLPELWFVAVGYQAISLLAYSIFLFDQNPVPNLVLATILNTAMMIILLWKQNQLSKNPPDQG